MLRENIPQTALQAIHDLLKIAQRDALTALFQTMKRRGRQADLSGELSIGLVAAFLAEKTAELFFERVAHPVMLAKGLFRLWNNC